MNAILAKMGFNRRFPRAVVFGPRKYQGKQLDNFAIQQYISHLVRFVGYVRLGDKMGDLVCVQIDQHQQLIESHKYSLELESTTYPMANLLGCNSCGRGTPN